MKNNIFGIILAAGKGTRIDNKSIGDYLPKVMLKLGEKPLIYYSIKAIKKAGISKPILIVGYKKEKVINFLGPQLTYIEQKEQLGTGHAVKVAAPILKGKKGTTVVIYGDMPFWKPETIQKAIQIQRDLEAKVVLTSAKVPESFMFGRVVRDSNGQVKKIIEAKDCSKREYKIKEMNASLYAFDNEWLFNNLGKIKNNNVKREYYLTDIVGIAIEQGKRVEAIWANSWKEALGVNTLDELKVAEEELAKHKLT